MKKQILCYILTLYLTSTASFAEINNDSFILNINSTLDNIYKKMYSGTFLSPADTSNLIDVKLKLDRNKDEKYAPIYYKLGKIFQKRGEREDAIECFKIITEDYINTPIAIKAIQELKTYGINIKTPTKIDTDEE